MMKHKLYLIDFFGGENVKFNKKLLVLLAVFMLILSAGAVSAEDAAADADDGSGDDASPMAGADDATDDGAEEGDDETDDEIDDEEFNETEDGMLLDASYAEGSASDSASAPATSASNLEKNAAGNPIFVLLVAIAGIGLTTLKRRY